MAGKRMKDQLPEDDTKANDNDFDAVEKQLEECKSRLENPPVRGATADGSPTQAVDPATVILLITTVLDLIKKWRNR